MKAFVTGVGGQLGYDVVNELKKRGYTAVGSDILEETAADCEYIKLDITDAEAVDYLNTAIGILRQVAKEQTSRIRHVTVNSSGSWGKDPVRPDLSMHSARLDVVAHQSETEVDQQYEPIIVDEDVFVVAKRM